MQPDSNTQTEQLPQIVERVNTATNVLVTVSNSPSVDQLAACIGLTIALNKQGKHATAVFSGKVPSTLEFLQPDRTIETNTNSLRDFIISLDKSKADKLRYKVEDDFVKIFITPYRTSIDEKDLAFTQGDFNIDLIITIGVHERAHLDATIVAHGRILHDAAVISMTTDTASEIGTVNWVDTEASSLCEMTSDLVLQINKELLDAQIATALLTGMVAETDRFGNDKARPHTMSVSGVLMAAGASPQLISSKLQEPQEPDDEIPAVVEDSGQGNSDEPDDGSQGSGDSEAELEVPKDNDGTIQIDHAPEDDIHIDEHGKLQAIKDLEDAQAALALEEEARSAATKEQPEPDSPQSEISESDNKMILEPPQLGGQLTANSLPEYQQYIPPADPMSNVASGQPLLERTENNVSQDTVTPPEMHQPEENKTLTDIEKAVNSPHITAQPNDEPADMPVSENVPPPPPVDDARAAVEQAVDSIDTYRPEPINALGATPVELDLGHIDELDAGNNVHPASDSPSKDNNGEAGNNSSDSAPPAVPPPLMPPGV